MAVDQRSQMANVRRLRQEEGSVNFMADENDGVVACTVHVVEHMVGKTLLFPDLNVVPPQTPSRRPQATPPSIGSVVSSGRRAGKRCGCRRKPPWNETASGRKLEKLLYGGFRGFTGSGVPTGLTAETGQHLLGYLGTCWPQPSFPCVLTLRLSALASPTSAGFRTFSCTREEFSLPSGTLLMP